MRQVVRAGLANLARPYLVQPAVRTSPTAEDVMIPAEWVVFVSVLCWALIYQHCMTRWSSKRAVRQAESTADDAYPSLVAFPPQHPSAADPPGTPASPHRNTTTPMMPGRSIPHISCIQWHTFKVQEDRRAEWLKTPTDSPNTTAGSRRAQRPRDKGAATVLPIDDRRPPSSFAMRNTAVREPSDTRGASVRNHKIVSRGGHLSRRAHVSGRSLESSSPLEGGQYALANRNEPTPGPRVVPSQPARYRQERLQPEDHAALEACDAAGSSLLSASLHRYYASIEASPQEASAYVTDKMEQARPSPSSFHSSRDQGQLAQRRTVRDIHGDKLCSST